jgi:hypothetical protein
MDLKTGIIVSLKHYSSTNLYKGLVADSNFERISVKLDGNSDFTVFQEGDPLALGFESDNLVYISSCNILNININENILILKSDAIETLSNKRLFERFPVSFNANVKIGSSKTEHQLFVKNISFNGMLTCSKIDFPLYQEIKIDFDIGNPVSLKAVIIRKTKEVSHYEYGLRIVYTDPHTPAILKKYLQNLKKEQDSYVSTIS